MLPAARRTQCQPERSPNVNVKWSSTTSKLSQSHPRRWLGCDSNAASKPLRRSDVSQERVAAERPRYPHQDACHPLRHVASVLRFHSERDGVLGSTDGLKHTRRTACSSYPRANETSSRKSMWSPERVTWLSRSWVKSGRSYDDPPRPPPPRISRLTSRMQVPQPVPRGCGGGLWEASRGP